ncbi:MAG: tol-pal system protein YbgF [Pseudomonadota bacterium]
MIYRRRGKGTAFGMALLLAAAPLVTASHEPAQAQIFGGNTDELETQIQRLQRDVRDLQAELFRNGVTPAGDPVTPSASPVMQMSTQRLDDIEEGLRRVTGDVETLTHQLNQMSQQMERMQNQLDYLENNQGAAALSSDFPLEGAVPLADGAGAPNGATGALALAPSEGVLSLPQNAPPRGPSGSLALPPAGGAPIGGGNPQDEFDAAMALLTRAQYDRAGEAFRAFSVTYPDTDLGAQALYWTGDIAYSVNNDYQVAARDFAELLRQYPDTLRAPEGMLKLGLSLLALGQKQEGCVTLAALPRTYPNASATIAERARDERQQAACN